ncbi:MAG: hypothetical protein AAF902_17250 [Chloroflexota bacterium]
MQVTQPQPTDPVNLEKEPVPAAEPKPSFARRLGGMLAYLLFLAVFFEVAFRIFFNIPVFIYMLPFDDAFEVKWYYWWLERHKNAGVEIYFSYDDYHETLGWVSKPNLEAHSSDIDDTSLSTNSNRLRMTYDVPYENTAGNQRILVLGDSFTFGENVNDDENYPYLLDQQLPDTTVINSGVHGYGHDQMLIYFQEEGVKYEPDIVMVGFLSTDVSRNVLKFRDFAKPKFELKDDELVLTNVPVPSPNEVLADSYWRSRTVDVGRIFYDIFRQRTGRLKAEQVEITTAILDEIVATTQEIGAVPMLVYMPWGEEITEDLAPVEWEAFMLDYCQQNPEVHCTTLRPEFADGLAEGTTYHEGHWKLPGHQVVADGTFDFLVESELVQP